MNESHKSENWWEKQNETVLSCRYPLHKAARDGDVETAVSLLESGKCTLLDEDTFYGWTPVHWAAHHGKLECLMQLLQHGASCDAPTIRLNQTPAHIAASAGQLFCLKWLVHCGASLNRKDYLEETPLHKAARTGSMECVSLLIAHGATLGLRNHCGHTASQVAAVAGFRECALHLEKSQQCQEQPTSFRCNNNNNEVGHHENGLSQVPPAANGHIDHSRDDVDMTCEMEISGEQIQKSHANGFIMNGFSTVMHNGCGGIKRGRDESDIDILKRRRCDELSDRHSEAATENNNILSSYNAILAISANPSSSSTSTDHSPDSQAARPFPSCSVDQSNGSSCPVIPQHSSHPTSNTIPFLDTPVKCLALHSHMI